MLSTSHGLRKPRVRTGCLTCRKRKKKCDEARLPETNGGCLRCKTAGFACLGYPDVKTTAATHPTRNEASSSSSSSLQQQPPPWTPRKASRTSAEEQDARVLVDAASAFAAGNSTLATPSQHPSSSSPATAAGVEAEAGAGPGNYRMVCSATGDCLLSGYDLCDGCLATIAPMSIAPDSSSTANQLPPHAFQPPYSPTPSTAPSLPPLPQQQHHQLPQSSTILPHPSATAISSSSSSAAATPAPNSLPQPLLHAIVGYYSTVVTCWVEGCHPSQLSTSPMFDGLVRRLTVEVETNTPLRLSMAAVAACYTQSDQLQWPREVDAVNYWTHTLKEASRSRMDRHLSLHASHLRRMASQVVDDAAASLPLAPPLRLAASSSSNSTSNATPTSTTTPNSSASVNTTSTTFSSSSISKSEELNLSQARAVDSLLVSRLNLAIFAWAEESIQSYHAEIDRAIVLVARLGLGRRVDLTQLHSLDTMGLRTLIWADICACLARGAGQRRPFFRLKCSTKRRLNASGNSDVGPATDGFYPAEAFSCPDEIMCCLCEVMLLRADAHDVGPSPSPLFKDAARRLEARLDACSTRGGAPGCAEMMRQAGKLLLYLDVLGLGPLERRCRTCLRVILTQWLTSGARDFCRAVGCGTYLLSVFVGASIAVDEADRLAFREALAVVGHCEVAPRGARTVIERVWARTDETGFPVRWTDVLGDDCLVAFF